MCVRDIASEKQVKERSASIQARFEHLDKPNKIEKQKKKQNIKKVGVTSGRRSLACTCEFLCSAVAVESADQAKQPRLITGSHQISTILIISQSLFQR